MKVEGPLLRPKLTSRVEFVVGENARPFRRFFRGCARIRLAKLGSCLYDRLEELFFLLIIASPARSERARRLS